MAVNGGSGNQIRFSELQSFYGGSHPIALSEYYRGGAQVPGSQASDQPNVSGTTSATVGLFQVTVSTAVDYAGSLSNTVRVSNAYTVTAADSALYIFGQTEDADGGRGSVTVNWLVNGVGASGQFEDNTGNGGGGVVAWYTGPAYQGGDQGDVGFAGGSRGALSAGNTLVFISASTGRPGSGIYHRTRAQRTLYTVTFRNTSGITLTTKGGTTGGAVAYAPNQTRTVISNSLSPNWALGYNGVEGNTSIPSSGQLSLNQFNTPGNPVP